MVQGVPLGFVGTLIPRDSTLISPVQITSSARPATTRALVFPIMLAYSGLTIEPTFLSVQNDFRG
jgi:hypothetical protein